LIIGMSGLLFIRCETMMIMMSTFTHRLVEKASYRMVKMQCRCSVFCRLAKDNDGCIYVSVIIQVSLPLDSQSGKRKEKHEHYCNPLMNLSIEISNESNSPCRHLWGTQGEFFPPNRIFDIHIAKNYHFYLYQKENYNHIFIIPTK
jgi:hypothetical protein